MGGSHSDKPPNHNSEIRLVQSLRRPDGARPLLGLRKVWTHRNLGNIALI